MKVFKITKDEAQYIENEGRCEPCGHLLALHLGHCCEWCNIPGCKCYWGEVQEDAPDHGK